MGNFFPERIFKEIQKNESAIREIKSFLSKKECKDLLEHLTSLKITSVGKNQTVNREESTKSFFTFDQSNFLKNLKNKIEQHIGEFFINDFQPHIITTRFPLRLHVDTGKNPNDIIFKNVVIPLDIIYDLDQEIHKKPHTVVFKNKWYNQASLFTKRTNNNYDFIIKDKNNNFIDIINILDFNEKLKKTSNGPFSYKNSEFCVNDKFREYIDSLVKTKRYNIRTDKHITNGRLFDKYYYEKFMSHQPYEDCDSLEIDKVLSWNIGSLLIWDRSRIHCSDNFLKNNVISKTCLALFTSKTKN